MIDRDRTLAKLDELDGYLGETVGHRLEDFDAFRGEILAFLRS